MASNSDFDTWKLPQLREYLIERGVTVTGHLKPVLISLCKNVCSLNLPKDPNFISVNIKQTIENKLKAIGCTFTNPFTINEGFTSDLTHAPVITLRDIFNYLVCSISDFDGERLLAWKSFNDTRLADDGHVILLEFNDEEDENFNIFRANVKPTQRDKTYTQKAYYGCWIILRKATNVIEVSYCECKGG